MAARDFWGDVQAIEVKTPLAILREQASMLGPKTKNLVEARVETAIARDQQFVHRFNLVVPPLDNYIYELFTIQHGIDLYPVKVPGTTQESRDEAEFTEWLRLRLASPETRRIVNNLVAQAQS